jgi:hypothetical protein
MQQTMQQPRLYRQKLPKSGSVHEFRTTNPQDGEWEANYIEYLCPFKNPNAGGTFLIQNADKEDDERKTISRRTYEILCKIDLQGTLSVQEAEGILRGISSLGTLKTVVDECNEILNEHGFTQRLELGINAVKIVPAEPVR